MTQEWHQIAADKILTDLRNRQGVGDELEEIDDDTLREIAQEIAQIIYSAYMNR